MAPVQSRMKLTFLYCSLLLTLNFFLAGFVKADSMEYQIEYLQMRITVLHDIQFVKHEGQRVHLERIVARIGEMEVNYREKYNFLCKLLEKTRRIALNRPAHPFEAIIDYFYPSEF